MSKYYTPKPEEFHVGFEYYLTNNNDEPTEKKYVFNKDLMLVLTAKTKVKYLDQEDIESLGWIAVEDFQALQLGIPQIFYVYNSKNKTYKLRHSQPDHLVITATYFNIFEGKIKNKSELKKLMQQLGINE